MGRGRLGVRVETLNPDLGGYFDVPNGKGVLVLEVLKGTPAERAGIKAGDVITRVDDRAVYDTDDLVTALRSKEGSISLDLVRHGDHRKIETELERAPRAMRFGPGRDMMGLREGPGRRGPASDDQDLRRELRELRQQMNELRQQLQEMKKD